MTKTTQDVSSKTAAAAVECIAETDALLQAAATEHQELTAKVASYEEGEEEFKQAIDTALETLSNTKLAGSDSPVLTPEQRETWDSFITDAPSRKQAAAHLITELISLNTKTAGDSGEGTTASSLGDVDEFPGRKAAADQDEDAVPTARY